MMVGLYALVVALFALVPGRVSWALLRNRGTAALGAVAGFALLGVGGAVAGTPAEAGSQPTDGRTSTAAAASSASSQAAMTTNPPGLSYFHREHVVDFIGSAEVDQHSCCSQPTKKRVAANGTALAAV